MIRQAIRADADAIARVHVDSWRETYRGLIGEAIIESRTIDRRTAQWTDSLAAADRVTFVACIQEVICGFASALVRAPSQGEARAYLETLYVMRAAQGAGIGKALLMSTAQELSRRGCNALLLHVLRDNRAARSFYEHLGGRYIKDRIQTDENDRWCDAAYEWTNLASLIDAHQEKPR